MSEQRQKTNQHKPKPFVQLAELPKTDGWLKGGVVIPFTKLTNEELQDALVKAEREELFCHNRSTFFGALVDKLITEADNRKLPVSHFETDFTTKNIDRSKKNIHNEENQG